MNKAQQHRIKALVPISATTIIIVLTLVGCSNLDSLLQLSGSGDSTTTRTFIKVPSTAPQAGQTGPQAIGDIGKWRLYQDVEVFTNEREVGALLSASNNFQLEVECSERTDSLNVRLDINVSLDANWDGERVTKTFEMRLGDDDAPINEQSDWYIASNAEWKGSDNAEWLVAPDGVSFANSLIANDDKTLKVRYTKDDQVPQTGDFTLKGSTNALSPVLGACDVPGYENQPDLNELAEASKTETSASSSSSEDIVTKIFSDTNIASDDTITTITEIFDIVKDSISVSRQELSDLLQKVFDAIKKVPSLQGVLNTLTNIVDWQKTLTALNQADLLEKTINSFKQTDTQPAASDTSADTPTTQPAPQNIPDTLQGILAQSCLESPGDPPANGCDIFAACVSGPTQTWIDAQGGDISIEDFGAAFLSDNPATWIENYMLSVLVQASECSISSDS